MIAVVDYGLGNIESIASALKKFTSDVVVTSNTSQIEHASKIVLPGTGYFSVAMEKLDRLKLLNPIIRSINAGARYLGIDLGMQIMFDLSYQAGKHTGLGMLPGKIVRFDFPPALTGRSLAIPHTGWDQIQIKPNCPLFRGIDSGTEVYFSHEFHAVTLEESIVCAACDYGYPFPAAVWKNNIYGVQFHPENSGDDGLKIFENFVNL